jgi:hypothetical protein
MCLIAAVMYRLIWGRHCVELDRCCLVAWCLDTEGQLCLLLVPEVLLEDCCCILLVRMYSDTWSVDVGTGRGNATQYGGGPLYLN